MFTPQPSNPEATVAELVRILREHVLTSEQIAASGGWWDQHGQVRDIIRDVLEELGVNGLHGCPLCCS